MSEASYRVTVSDLPCYWRVVILSAISAGAVVETISELRPDLQSQHRPEISRIVSFEVLPLGVHQTGAIHDSVDNTLIRVTKEQTRPALLAERWGDSPNGWTDANERR